MTINHQRRPRYPQLTFGTLLLGISLIGTLMAWHRTHREVEQVQHQVVLLRQLARELKMDDPAQISVVDRLPTLSGETVLDFYLPPGKSKEPPYQLCLALEGIAGHGHPSSEFPHPDQAIAVASGVHSIEVRHHQADRTAPNGQHEIEILLDNDVVLHAVRPAAWQSSSGWSSTGSYRESKSFGPDERVELHRRRFHQATATGSQSVGADSTTTGILLWIEPIAMGANP